MEKLQILLFLLMQKGAKMEKEFVCFILFFSSWQDINQFIVNMLKYYKYGIQSPN